MLAGLLSQKRRGAWDAPRKLAPMLRKSPTGTEEVCIKNLCIMHANNLYSNNPIAYLINAGPVDLYIAPFWH